jgi:hypothetical protein
VHRETHVVDLAAERSRLGGPYRLPCPRCARPVFQRATRCPHCGLWFDGEAYQFTSDTDRFARGRAWAATRRALWLGVVAAVLTVLTLIVGFAL